MNKGKKVLFTVLLLFVMLLFNNVYASECTDNDIANLKAIAEKIEFSKKFVEGERDDGRAFALVAHNLNKNLMLEFTNGQKFIPTKTDDEIMTFLDGEKIVIQVYASRHHVCEDTYITTLDVNLPVYNKYYNREECKGKEAADICKQWYDADDISEEEFLKLVAAARVTNPPIQKTNWFIDFITKYWMVLAGIVVVGGISYGTVLIIRRKKRVKIDI